MNPPASGEDLDLATLTYEEFEFVVGALLARMEYKSLKSPRLGQRGPDFDALTSSGDRVVVLVKHFNKTIPRSILDRFVGDLERYRLQTPDAKGIIVVSGDVPISVLHDISKHSWLTVWTGVHVKQLLKAHPDVAAAAAASSEALRSLSMMATAEDGVLRAAASNLFTDRLKRITPGRDDWRDFELWCTEILTAIFEPELGPPDQQTRSDDGLDIMDAIFPIRSDTTPWSLIRAEYATRFVVAEFKNYGDPVGPKQVESIAQYLWKPAKRRFGLLISRNAPNSQAMAQRRREWLEQEKMIIFLTDIELIEMLILREEGQKPFDVIDAKLEFFLRTLTP